MITIKELLKEGVNLLEKRKGSVLDCEVLLAYSLGVERDYLVSHGEEEVGADLIELFNLYLNRIKEGEPIAYVTGRKEFFGLDFFVDKRVLIPRPETELVVEKVLDYLRENDGFGEKFKIVDVGTGSGNIAVSVVVGFEGEGEIERVDAVDFDEKALEVAKINVLQHGVEEQVHVFQADLLDFVENGERYDAIVANLPYIGEEKNRFVSAETEKYEPNIALFGGHDGLELYKKMFQQIVDKKISYGVIIGEFGFAQREDMEKLLDKYFDQRWWIEKDLAGIDRIFVITG